MNSCAWLLHPNIKNQGKGMLEVPWLAVELREWFASSRSTFHWLSVDFPSLAVTYTSLLLHVSSLLYFHPFLPFLTFLWVFTMERRLGNVRRKGRKNKWKRCPVKACVRDWQRLTFPSLGNQTMRNGVNFLLSLPNTPFLINLQHERTSFLSLERSIML